MLITGDSGVREMSQQTIKEIWKPIPNYENEYIVSNLGNFKSLPKTVWNGHGFYITSEKNIKPYKTKKGYLHIDLRDKTFKAHRIVAQVFIPNPLKKPQVNHINGLKYDNRVYNLEWCDNSENQIHAYKNNLNKRSEKAGRSKISVEQYNLKTNETIKIWDSYSDIRDFYKVKHNNFRECCEGNRKSCLGFGWRKVNA